MSSRMVWHCREPKWRHRGPSVKILSGPYGVLFEQKRRGGERLAERVKEDAETKEGFIK